MGQELPPLENCVKRKLLRGQLAIGLGVYHLRTAATALLARTCGYDWLFILGEHGSFSRQEVAQLCLSALATGVSPIVQICADALDEGTRALDNGAQGIILPHVDTPEDAARAVRAFRYPPVGRRSWGGPQALLNYCTSDLSGAQARINDEILITVMLETPEAVKNAAAIASVPGVDALLLGATDLSMELGIPGQASHERIREAVERVAAACRQHGKICGLGGVYDPPLLQRYVGLGARLILAGSDQSFLIAAAKKRAEFLRSLDLEQ